MGTFVSPILPSTAVAMPAARRCTERHAWAVREVRLSIVAGDDDDGDVDDEEKEKKTACRKPAPLFGLLFGSSGVLGAQSRRSLLPARQPRRSGKSLAQITLIRTAAVPPNTTQLTNSTAGNCLFSAFHPALFHAPLSNTHTSSLTHRRRHQTPQLLIGAAQTPSDTLGDTVQVSSDSTAQKDLQAPALPMRTLPASSSAQ